MTVINTNVKALYTQAALNVSNRDSQVAMQQLSTGKRINSSKDDAAGLAIAARMSQNIQGLKQAVRNAGDAISMIQTAEGATQEITVMLQRMSELAVQSANSTYSADQRSYLDQEFQQLKQEIVRVSEMHEWNGFPILNGKAGTPVGLPTTATETRAGVAATGSGKALETGDLEIQTTNGSYAIPASIAAADSKSNTIAAGSNNAGSAIAIAAAINSQVGVTGVSAVAGAATIGATETTVGLTSIQTDLYVNGEKVSLSLSASHTESQRRQYVMESINAGTTVHGVLAGDSGTGGLTLTTPDGRNLSVWYDSTSVQGSDFGLGLDTTPPSNPLGVTGVSGTAASTFGDNETTVVTFPELDAGEGFTLNGLTFTSTATTTAIELAAAFSNLTSGMSALAAAAANADAVTNGSFTGTFAEGFTTGDNNDTAVVTATATSKGNVGNIATSDSVPTIATVAGSAAPTAPVSTFVVGVDGTKSTETVVFSNLAAGKAVTVNGLTFTATAAMTNIEVAAAFSAVLSGETAAQVTARNTVSAALGAYSGTNTAGYASAVTTTATAVYTSVDEAAATFAAVPTTTGATAPVSTFVVGVVKSTETVVFSGIAAGNSVTVNGLTFTATNAMTDVQVGAAFSGVLSGETAAQVTARNTVSAGLGTYSGTNTAGYASAVTTTATAVYTSVADAAATFAAAPTSTGTTENSVITFKALNPNDFVTVNGLTFTARVNMTANEVAAAFANVTSEATAAELTLANPVAANFGKYSGTFTAGFSTGDSTTTGTVTATSTTLNANVTNLAVNGVLAPTTTNTTAGSTVAASTVYGTVTLNSQISFTIKPSAVKLA